MICANNMMASKKKLTKGMLLSLGVCMMISYGTFGMNDSNKESNDDNNNNQNNFNDAQLGNNMEKKIKYKNIEEEKLDNEDDKESYNDDKFYNDTSNFVNNQDNKFQNKTNNFPRLQIYANSECEEYRHLNDSFNKNPYNNNDSGYISMSTINLDPHQKKTINHHKHVSVTDITNKIQNDAYYLTKFKNTLSDNGVQLVYQGCCGGCCGNGAIDFKNTMIKYGEKNNETISLGEFLVRKYGNDEASSLGNNKTTSLPLLGSNNINNNLNTQNTDNRLKIIEKIVDMDHDANLKQLGDALDKMLSEWEVSKPGLSGQNGKQTKKINVPINKNFQEDLKNFNNGENLFSQNQRIKYTMRNNNNDNIINNNNDNIINNNNDNIINNNNDYIINNNDDDISNNDYNMNNNNFNTKFLFLKGNLSFNMSNNFRNRKQNNNIGNNNGFGYNISDGEFKDFNQNNNNFNYNNPNDGCQDFENNNNYNDKENFSSNDDYNNNKHNVSDLENNIYNPNNNNMNQEKEKIIFDNKNYKNDYNSNYRNNHKSNNNNNNDYSGSDSDFNHNSNSNNNKNNNNENHENADNNYDHNSNNNNENNEDNSQNSNV